MAHEYGPLSRPLEETLAALREGLVHGERCRPVPTHRRSRRLRRMRRWSREIGRLAQRALPRIEQDTGYVFRWRDALTWILMTPSIQRFFSATPADVGEDALPVCADELARLASISADVQALALIGEVTLRLKVPSGPDVPGADLASLSDRWAATTFTDVASPPLIQGLAALSDRWGLHEDRMDLRGGPRPAGEVSAREKETLVWAVLGLIYVEGGTDALGRAATLLAGGREG